MLERLSPWCGAARTRYVSEAPTPDIAAAAKLPILRRCKSQENKCRFAWEICNKRDRPSTMYFLQRRRTSPRPYVAYERAKSKPIGV
jgi:hypothetical protein